ncbi:MAG TPA: cysteine--tRNA ligase [Candidatus Xenobia bacterium]|jgi:cysteinyl-tRNA synthetase
MSIRFFNTMTRQLEPFKPIHPGEARLYTCGPTVYNFAHIGNFRAYVFEDVLRRYLKYRGYKVFQVMNITDVEDKIIRTHRETGQSRAEISEPFIQAFHEDRQTLNVESAEAYPKASEHIARMVAIIQKLLEKGIAYRGEDGSIYYSIAKFPAYGRLAHIQVEELKSGARVAHDEYDKERASDFALWKAWDEKDGDIYWETALGKGRPGWHIECSAMSMELLGSHFDIHTGGEDNIFPHHENEIAQSEAYTGEKFVNYWLHCKHLLVENQKMSKSTGNFYTLRDLLDKGYSATAIRYVYVSSQYNRPLNFTLDDLSAKSRAVQGLMDFLRRLRDWKGAGGVSEEFKGLLNLARTGFEAAMDDDMNTPEALEALFILEREINKRQVDMTEAEAKAALDFYLDVDRVLGLKLETVLKAESLDVRIQGLVDEREAARKAKDWKKADQLRDALKAEGVVLEDTPQGVRWKKAS